MAQNHVLPPQAVKTCDGSHMHPNPRGGIGQAGGARDAYNLRLHSSARWLHMRTLWNETGREVKDVQLRGTAYRRGVHRLCKGKTTRGPLDEEVAFKKKRPFFTHKTVEKDMENVCKKIENISSKTYDTAARPFQKFLYRWENFCKTQHLLSITYVTPRVGDLGPFLIT